MGYGQPLFGLFFPFKNQDVDINGSWTPANNPFPLSLLLKPLTQIQQFLR